MQSGDWSSDVCSSDLADSSPGFPEADPRAIAWRTGCLQAHLASSLPTGSLFPWSSQDRARSIRWTDQLWALALGLVHEDSSSKGLLEHPPGPGLSLTTFTHGQSSSPQQKRRFQLSPESLNPTLPPSGNTFHHLFPTSSWEGGETLVSRHYPGGSRPSFLDHRA